LENKAANDVSSMTGVCDSDTESYDEELTYEELASTYKELCIRSKEICRTVVEQKAIIDQLKIEKEKLQVKVTGLQNEVKLLSSNLENMTMSVRMLNPGIKKLDEILRIRNHANDPTEVGYGKIYNNETLESNFVPAQNGSEFEVMLPHPTLYVATSFMEVSLLWQEWSHQTLLLYALWVPKEETSTQSISWKGQNQEKMEAKSHSNC
jgi:hypothetical protein